MASPDDLCGVCGTTREMHGDKHHLFTLDQVLTPLQPGPTPRRGSPRERVAGAVENQTAGLVLRLIERLAKRGLLVEADLVAIFGGTSDPSTNSQADDSAGSDHSSRAPERDYGVDPPR